MLFPDLWPPSQEYQQSPQDSPLCSCLSVSIQTSGNRSIWHCSEHWSKQFLATVFRTQTLSCRVNPLQKCSLECAWDEVRKLLLAMSAPGLDGNGVSDNLDSHTKTHWTLRNACRVSDKVGHVRWRVQSPNPIQAMPKNWTRHNAAAMVNLKMVSLLALVATFRLSARCRKTWQSNAEGPGRRGDAKSWVVRISQLGHANLSWKATKSLSELSWPSQTHPPFSHWTFPFKQTNLAERKREWEQWRITAMRQRCFPHKLLRLCLFRLKALAKCPKTIGNAKDGKDFPCFKGRSKFAPS